MNFIVLFSSSAGFSIYVLVHGVPPQSFYLFCFYFVFLTTIDLHFSHIHFSHFNCLVSLKEIYASELLLCAFDDNLASQYTGLNVIIDPE